uniref:ATP synthase complex subunit 8 n=1 Tax=Teloganodidae sp. MT-2014 TaxID=1560024 RepID=A0A0A0RZE9_9INSE|nr:ATP synthase F0 subunit 8 [Teloganodidae sp. MT-2014]
MPQMAPMSWLILFLLFCITFLTFTILNYFMKPMSITTKLSRGASIHSSVLTWSW